MMIRLIARARFALTLAVVVTTSSVVAQQTRQGKEQSSQHQHETTPQLFPAREASGTAWLPDETPMYAIQRRLGTWELTLHGNGFGQFLYEPGEKHRTGGFSSRQVSSANWLMAMARRPLGVGRVGLRTMVSAEPWTVRDCGFINLLASGEMCEGDTIHDLLKSALSSAEPTRDAPRADLVSCVRQNARSSPPST